MSGIGLLNEKSLHASLKEWYAQPGDKFEVKVDGYVIDIVRDNLLIEIQTGSFVSIRSKLNNLIQSHRVRLVYPVAQEKWIVKLSKNSDAELSRRKSPKQGRVEQVFREMVSFPKLIANPNFSIEILMIQEEEWRRHYNGKRNWRRRGWGTVERHLLEVMDKKLFEKPTDWLALLPDALNKSFTTKDLSETTGMRKSLAQKMVYCFRKVELIKLTGKIGRYNLYMDHKS